MRISSRAERYWHVEVPANVSIQQLVEMLGQVKDEKAVLSHVRFSGVSPHIQSDTVTLTFYRELDKYEETF